MLSFSCCPYAGKKKKKKGVGVLTGVCDRETVGGLQVVNIVIEVEGFLGHILVGVIELDSKPEGAVLLHCRAHEQSTCRREHVTHQHPYFRVHHQYA